ncbi:MAG: hypothetical protein ACI90V_009868 [Bacillariaceae sp.]|jgi:hypothetical protein
MGANALDSDAVATRSVVVNIDFILIVFFLLFILMVKDEAV